MGTQRKDLPAIYLIPGLGADHRIFSKLDLSGLEVHHLDWPEMPTGSSLEDYAAKLAKRVDAGRPHVLVGVSMGGMVAQELASLTGPEKVVLISTWTGPEEMPPPIRALRHTHPEKLLTKTVLESSLPLIRWQMGAESAEEQRFLEEQINAHSIDQLKVQIGAVLGWEGPRKAPKHMVRIHGSKDRLMPRSYIKDARMVPKGGHLMVYDKADEVGRCIREALSA